MARTAGVYFARLNTQHRRRCAWLYRFSIWRSLTPTADIEACVKRHRLSLRRVGRGATKPVLAASRRASIEHFAALRMLSCGQMPARGRQQHDNLY